MTGYLDNSVSLSTSELKIHQTLCAILRNALTKWPSTGAAFFETFQKKAKHHGIEALVCQLLKSTPMWETIPEQVRRNLLQTLRLQAVIEMVRRLDLLTLLERFREENLSVLLLKGEALAYTHYSDPYLRFRSDTDIFVSPHDIKIIQRVFHELGYQNRGPTYKSHQFSFSKKAVGDVVVIYDVHWRLSNVARFARVLSFEKGLKKSIPIPALNDCPTLCPEEALTLACMHLAGNPDHDPDRLIWLYDIHLLVSEMSEPRLLQFSKKAVKENIHSVCLSAIRRSQNCFNTRISNQVFEILLTPSGTHSIDRRFRDSYLGLIIDDLRCLPDAGSRLALIRELLAPSAEELLQKYDKRSVFWIPGLYVRYLLHGLLKRFSLH